MQFVKYIIPYGFLLLYLFIGSFQGFGQPKIVQIQDTKVDSLEAKLQNTESDSIKVLLWCAIAKEQSIASKELGMETAQKALRNAKRLNNLYLIGKSLFTIGELNFQYDKMQVALDYFQQVDALADTLNRIDLQINTKIILGDYYYQQEVFESGLAAYYEAKKLLDNLNDKTDYNLLGETLNKIGMVHLNNQNHKEAFKSYRDALAVFESQKNKVGITQTYINLGKTFLAQSHFEEAIEYFEAALEVANDAKNQNIIATTYYSIGLVKYEQKQYNKALESYLNAADMVTILEDPTLKAMINTAIGLTYLRQNEIVKGIDFERKALGIYQSNNDLHGVAKSLNRLGSDYKSNSISQAVMNLQEALKINIQLGVPHRQCENYINLGYVYTEQNKYNDALIVAKKAATIADNIQNKPLMIKSNKLLTKIYGDKKQYREAYITQQKYESLSDSLEKNKKRHWLENTSENRLAGNRRFSTLIKRLRFWAVFSGIVALLLISLNVYFYKSLIFARKEVAERDRLLEIKQADYRELKAILKKVIGDKKL